MKKYFFYKTNQILKIDFEILSKLGSKKNSLAILFAIVSKNKKAIAINEIKNIVFGTKKDPLHLSKSSFYQAIADLKKLNIVDLKNQNIYLKTKVFSHGQKPFIKIFNKQILKTIGKIAASHLKFLLISNSLVSKQKKLSKIETLDQKCAWEMAKTRQKDLEECLNRNKVKQMKFTFSLFKKFGFTYFQIKSLFSNLTILKMLKNIFNITIHFKKILTGPKKAIVEYVRSKKTLDYLIDIFGDELIIKDENKIQNELTVKTFQVIQKIY